MVAFPEHLTAALPPDCLKTNGQPFFGTVFVLQKTCVITMDFRRVSCLRLSERGVDLGGMTIQSASGQAPSRSLKRVDHGLHHLRALIRLFHKRMRAHVIRGLPIRFLRRHDDDGNILGTINTL